MLISQCKLVSLPQTLNTPSLHHDADVRFTFSRFLAFLVHLDRILFTVSHMSRRDAQSFEDCSRTKVSKRADENTVFLWNRAHSCWSMTFYIPRSKFKGNRVQKPRRFRPFVHVTPWRSISCCRYFGHYAQSSYETWPKGTLWQDLWKHEIKDDLDLRSRSQGDLEMFKN